MKILYFYSNSCGSCKDYERVVDRLSTELNIEAEKRNIEVMDSSFNLTGVPTLLLIKDNEEIYRSVGNLPYEYLLKAVNNAIDNDK